MYNVNMNGLNPKQIPQESGVYFFKDDKGNILYIGKASNLRNRVSSYFKVSQTNSRIVKMLETSTNVTWQITASEIEALILESQLIKKNKPPFNVMLRDDKQYFYVVFTNETFPKIFLTHQPQSQDSLGKNKIVGPFTDGLSLKTTLRLLRKIFPYCSCKQKHNNFCLNYHIGKCLGFCCLKNPKIKQGEVQEYQKNILAIKNLLSGKKNSLIKAFEKKMNELGESGDFEKAIELRDKISKLKRIFENALILRTAKETNFYDTNNPTLKKIKTILKLGSIPQRIEGYDISNIQGKMAVGSMVVFTNGQPDKKNYRKFKIKSSQSPDDTAMLKEVLVRRFKHPEWDFPHLILIDGGKGQLSAAESCVPKNISIVALTKNDKHRGDHIYAAKQKAAMPLEKLSSDVHNLLLLIDSEAHRFAIRYYRELHLKNQKS